MNDGGAELRHVNQAESKRAGGICQQHLDAQMLRLSDKLAVVERRQLLQHIDGPELGTELAGVQRLLLRLPRQGLPRGSRDAQRGIEWERACSSSGKQEVEEAEAWVQATTSTRALTAGSCSAQTEQRMQAWPAASGS